MKILYVGDVHATPQSLEECVTFLHKLTTILEENPVDAIVFLGDQFHTHSIINMAVLGFWKRAFETLVTFAPVYALVGNHDMTGKHGDYLHSMMAYDIDNFHVVDELMGIAPGMLLCPYIADPEVFIEALNEPHNASNVVICHQTFEGSAYENGFYAKDGVNPNLIPQKLVISGHIHTPQSFGKVWYPGSPRWQTIADANTGRAVWVVEHDADGMIKNKTAYDTSSCFTPIFAIEDREGAPLPALPVSGKVLMDVYGSEPYVKAKAAEYEEKGYRVRPFPTITRALKVRESEGLAKSFVKFMAQYKTKNGTSPEIITKKAAERISWLKGAV